MTTHNNKVESFKKYIADDTSTYGLAVTPEISKSSSEQTQEETTSIRGRSRSKKVNKLTDHQVRINHVSSEKRRREMIRSIYDDLVRMVPGLDPKESRSELIIYMKTMAYMKWLYRKNQRLREQLHPMDIISEEELVQRGLAWELEDDVDLPSPPHE